MLKNQTNTYIRMCYKCLELQIYIIGFYSHIYVLNTKRSDGSDWVAGCDKMCDDGKKERQKKEDNTKFFFFV